MLIDCHAHVIPNAGAPALLTQPGPAHPALRDRRAAVSAPADAGRAFTTRVGVTHARWSVRLSFFVESARDALARAVGRGPRPPLQRRHGRLVGQVPRGASTSFRAASDPFGGEDSAAGGWSASRATSGSVGVLISPCNARQRRVPGRALPGGRAVPGGGRPSPSARQRSSCTPRATCGRRRTPREFALSVAASPGRTRRPSAHQPG